MEKIDNLTIHKDASLNEALKKIEKGGERIAFVINENSSLYGVLSDGDIRRWIINTTSLEGKVSEICNRNPIVLKCNYNNKEAKRIMLDNIITVLPVINDESIIVDILLWENIFGEKPKNKRVDAPVVIMAGGRGTRLDPFTRILPKALIPFGERPMLEVIMSDFNAYGITSFHVSINDKARIIKAYFEEQSIEYNISFIEEDKPLGTAGALRFMLNKFNKPFFVTNCDIIIEVDYADIYHFHNNGNYDITLVASLKQYKIPYGVCELNNSGHLDHINEKPEYKFLVNAGVYVINPNVLELIPENTFFHITFLIEKIIGNGGKVGVYPISEKAWKDVGQWAEYNKAFSHIINKK